MNESIDQFVERVTKSAWTTDMRAALVHIAALQAERDEIATAAGNAYDRLRILQARVKELEAEVVAWKKLADQRWH